MPIQKRSGSPGQGGALQKTCEWKDILEVVVYAVGGATAIFALNGEGAQWRTTLYSVEGERGGESEEALGVVFRGEMNISTMSKFGFVPVLLVGALMLFKSCVKGSEIAKSLIKYRECFISPVNMVMVVCMLKPVSSELLAVLVLVSILCVVASLETVAGQPVKAARSGGDDGDSDPLLLNSNVDSTSVQRVQAAVLREPCSLVVRCAVCIQCMVIPVVTMKDNERRGARLLLICLWIVPHVATFIMRIVKSGNVAQYAQLGSCCAYVAIVGFMVFADPLL